MKLLHDQSGLPSKLRGSSGGSILTRVTGGGGGDLVPTMPGCVCPKVKDMGPFSASKE